MRIVQVNFFMDPALAPERVLEQWPSLTDIAAAARLGGAHVSVIQACASARLIRHHDIDYHFLPVAAGQLLARTPGFSALLRALAPQVVHVHGLGFAREVLALAAVSAAPILLQDHADQMPRRFWRRWRWRRSLAAAAGVSVTALAQAEALRLPPHLRVFQVVESTSRFTPADQAQAQRASGMHGDPCVLWVGNLDGNKDPLTVLEGFSAALAELPGAQLWCHYGAAPLMAQVKHRIARDPALAARVHLLGSATHANIERAMRSATCSSSAAIVRAAATR